jgi:hypothetical protein
MTTPVVSYFEEWSKRAAAQDAGLQKLGCDRLVRRPMIEAMVLDEDAGLGPAAWMSGQKATSAI